MILCCLRFLWGLKLKLWRSTYSIAANGVPMGTVRTSVVDMPLTVGEVVVYPSGQSREITVTGPCRKLMRVTVNGKALS
jgi:hypothetical protein